MIYLAVVEGRGYPTPMADENLACLEAWLVENAQDCKWSVWEQEGVSIKLLKRHYGYFPTPVSKRQIIR